MSQNLPTIGRGRGDGYIAADGTICMERCFNCGRTNYAPCVSSGKCWWCKFEAGKHEPKNETNLILTDKRRPCNDCAGFGVFEGDTFRTILAMCGTCRSIHPESLGLMFKSDDKELYAYIGSVSK